MKKILSVALVALFASGCASTVEMETKVEHKCKHHDQVAKKEQEKKTETNEEEEMMFCMALDCVKEDPNKTK